MLKRTDDNQKEIVSGLRSVGAAVCSMAPLGKGAPDLLVAFRGRWFVAEVKDGSKPPSRQKLTDHEIRWHQVFHPRAPVLIWTSLDDALAAIGAK